MTDLPTDPLDAYERPLTRAVRRFSDQAVVPINAADVAHTAIADARPPSLAERLGGVWSGAGMVGRLGTVAAAGLLAVLGMEVLALGLDLPIVAIFAGLALEAVFVLVILYVATTRDFS